MKIGVMSDSHDNLPVIRRALERFEAEGAEASSTRGISSRRSP